MSHVSKKTMKKPKHCTGCGDIFLDYGNNCDYCEDCAVNGSRYARNQCPECGDGSGWVKFANQSLRACKLCALTKNPPTNPPANPPPAQSKKPTKKPMTKLKKYPKKDFTCDGCQTAFKKAAVYSPATSAKNLSKNKTYCAKCAEQLKIAPASGKNRVSKAPATNQNTLAYYQCLCEHSQQGFPAKITQVCHDCKHNSAAIITQQAKQRDKLISVYKQLGGCLEKIFHPAKHPSKSAKKKK